MHGDCGRTTPSLASLLGAAACVFLSLDVTDVRMDDAAQLAGLEGIGDNADDDGDE